MPAADKRRRTSSAVRVLLADDHGLIVEGMRALLERIDGVMVVAVAYNGREALAMARKHRPDLAIMDISMEELNGIEAAAQLRDELPGTHVLILSSHTGEQYVHRALRAGAAGYLVKDSMPGELATAVGAVMEGKKYLSPAICGHVMAGFGRHAAAALEDPLSSLTSRQREILQLIAEGKATKEIAFALGISVKTVETHRAALMERLGIRDVAGLVLFAVRHGVVRLDSRD
jgi:DNA-binding NarL/FixJ family response regulator